MGDVGGLLTTGGAIAAVAGLIGLMLKNHASRIDGLEKLVDLLRRELDKGLTREGAVLGMARVLLLAVDQEPNPTPAMISARAHAQEIVNAAHDRIFKRGGNNGGTA